MKLSIILMNPPSGGTRATEAVRYAIGALREDMELITALVSAGVLAAHKGREGAGDTTLGKALKEIMDRGGAVLVERASLKEFGIGAEDLIETVTPANGYDISTAVRDADRTMIF